MRKCLVLNDTAIAIKKGSIVIVDERQYELARRNLKPIEEDEVLETPKPKRQKKK